MVISVGKPYFFKADRNVLTVPGCVRPYCSDNSVINSIPKDTLCPCV